MKCLSLFTGIGGFDLALKRAGHEIVGACEIDEWARRIYAKHFPGVHIHRDATKIIAEELPDFDLLVAGFPCQTFSIAGNRLGFEESRGTLFFEIARITKQKRPRLLLLENVKGLLNHDGGKTFAVILATLDELGYDAQWQVLNSKYFVPQNRERVFIIANLRGTSRPEVFPLGEVSERTDQSRSEASGERERLPNEVSGTIDANYWKGVGTRTHVLEPNIKKVGSVKRKQTKHSQMSDHNGSRVYDPDHIGPTIDASHEPTKIIVGHVNDSQSGIVYGIGSSDKEPKLDHIGNVDDKGHNSKWGRVYDPKGGLAPTVMAEGGGLGAKTGLFAIPVLTPDRPEKRQNGRRFKEDGEEMFTLTAQDKHGILAENKIRRLTPKECERLQGFHDDYTKFTNDGTEISDTQRYKMCGNAVTVNVIEYIMEYLK